MVSPYVYMPWLAGSVFMFKNRKTRKLLRDPELFFTDMVRKKPWANRLLGTQRRQVTDKLRAELARFGVISQARGKVMGRHRFTVITPVYDAEAYLQRYFESLIQQTLDFGHHIDLVLVDDGSTDRSAQIIAEWQARFPNNIQLFTQENSGAAAARNVGLEHVKGDWVVFVDADDFLAPGYFEAVEKFLAGARANEVALICTHLVVYRDATDTFANTHTLKKFFDKDKVIRAAKPEKFIVTSAAGAFFRQDVLRASGLRFAEELRHGFDGGHFVSRFLLDVQSSSIGVVAGADYYFRQREDKLSLSDLSWMDPERFTVVPVKGYEGVLDEAVERLGSVPEWLSRVVLCELNAAFKYLVNRPERCVALSPEDALTYKQSLARILQSAEIEPMLGFELASASFYNKVGWFGIRQTPLPHQIVYPLQWDPVKRLMQLQYFYVGERPMECITINDADVCPVYAKDRVHDFMGDLFVMERLLWLPVLREDGKLSVELGGVSTRVSVGGTRYQSGVSLRKVTEKLRPAAVRDSALQRRSRNLRRAATSSAVADKYRDVWLFADRDINADDSGEILYRYVQKRHPEINSFFVLSKKSHDWARLSAEGFRLIDCGSSEHELALLNARHLVSSHANLYVHAVHPLVDFADMLTYKFTFLQHGIIKDDLSLWLNARPIECFVTSTPDEYESIAGDNNRYKYSHREVALTGLPRHDALLASDIKPDKMILIMPTWRNYIVGGFTGDGTDRALNPEFYESDYATHWKGLLHSPKLKELAKEHGYRIVFFPHTNIEPYLDWFDVPDGIELGKFSKDEAIRDRFCQAGVLLTDYSSVAFEISLLRKPVLYYQFDREEMFGGGHTGQAGYFKYYDDGFGPVCTEQASLLRALEEVLVGGVQPKFLERMEATLPFRDGNNCRRTLDAIVNLDEPETNSGQALWLLLYAARQASAEGSWRVAAERWAQLLSLLGEGAAANSDRAIPDDIGVEVMLALSETERELGHFELAREWLGKVLAEGGQGPKVKRVQARLACASGDYQHAKNLWQSLLNSAAVDSPELTTAQVGLAQVYRCSGDMSAAADMLEGVESTVAVLVERAKLAQQAGNWTAALEGWSRVRDGARGVALSQALIGCVEVRRKLGLFEAALVDASELVRISLARDSSLSLILKAELLQLTGRQEALSKLVPVLRTQVLSEGSAREHIRAARLFSVAERYRFAEAILDAGVARFPTSQAVFEARISYFRERKNWEALLGVPDPSFDTGVVEPYRRLQAARAEACRELGRYSDARAILGAFPVSIDNAALLSEKAEACYQASDWAGAIATLEALHSRFPEHRSRHVTVRLVQSYVASGEVAKAAETLRTYTAGMTIERLQDHSTDLAVLGPLLFGLDSVEGAAADRSGNSELNEADKE